MTIAKDPSKFVETQIDDEVVLMDLASGDFFSLDGTSLAIWRMIDGSRDEAQIVSAIAKEYGVEAAQVAADVGAFLSDLGALGLIDR